MDHAIRRPGRTAQAVESVKIAAMYPDPGLGEGSGRGVRAGEAGDLMARTDELGNKGGADPAGRASDKNAHAQPPYMSITLASADAEAAPDLWITVEI